jgi:glycosidase
MYHHIDRFFGPNPTGDVQLFADEDPADPETWQWSSADSLFLKLIGEAHNRNIRVIIDGVFNHTGTDFWAFQDLAKHQGQSPYKEWYHVKSFDDPKTDENEFDYEGWWGFKSLPEFREEEGNLVQPVRDHIFAITKRWMDPNGDGDPSDGVDGWRLDVAGEVGFPFWEEWHAYIRTINPEVYTVAEEWDDKAVEFVHEDRFNAVMNYRFTRAVDDYFITGKKSQTEFTNRMMELLGQFGEASHSVQNLMDSHDTERIASRVMNTDRSFKEESHADQGFNPRKPDAEARKIQQQVAVLQFTWPGAPMLYYGTEAGMWGADDPDDRKPMVWPDYEYDPEVFLPDGSQHEPDPVSFDEPLFHFYQSLIYLRNESPVLQHGRVRLLKQDDLFAFTRGSDDEIAVYLNRANASVEFEIEKPGTVMFIDEQSSVEGSKARISARGWMVIAK